jgi:DNA polymerase-1
LKQLLYGELGLPPVIKDGKVTVDKLALKKLKAKVQNPIFDLVLECRRALKQDSTSLNCAQVRQGRMHTSYNIGGKIADFETGRSTSAPETGRLSSSASIVFYSGANLQNQTRGILRSIYLPEPGEVLLEADLSQAEARVVAFESADDVMIQVFTEGLDIHMMNAELIKSVAPSVFKTYGEDMKRLRNEFAKNHVHAFNYGEGPWMFAERAGIPRGTGEVIRNAYFNKYQGLRGWHKEVETALRSGLAKWKVPVRTLRNLFGRKRHFFGRLDESTMREGFAFVPQSTVGDLLNIQFLGVWNACRELGLTAKPLLQVHDSQVWSVPRGELPTLCRLIREKADIELTSSDGLRKFKIPVELKVGENWGEMKEWKDD